MQVTGVMHWQVPSMSSSGRPLVSGADHGDRHLRHTARAHEFQYSMYTVPHVLEYGVCILYNAQLCCRFFLKVTARANDHGCTGGGRVLALTAASMHCRRAMLVIMSGTARVDHACYCT